jgi:hypothetical protein
MASQKIMSAANLQQVLTAIKTYVDSKGGSVAAGDSLRLRAILATNSDISSVSDLAENDLIFVQSDSTHQNRFTMYVYSGTAWSFIEEIDLLNRNFSTTPVELSELSTTLQNTINGIPEFESYAVDEIVYVLFKLGYLTYDEFSVPFTVDDNYQGSVTAHSYGEVWFKFNMRNAGASIDVVFSDFPTGFDTSNLKTRATIYRSDGTMLGSPYNDVTTSMNLVTGAGQVPGVYYLKVQTATDSSFSQPLECTVTCTYVL